MHLGTPDSWQRWFDLNFSPCGVQGLVLLSPLWDDELVI